MRAPLEAVSKRYYGLKAAWVGSRMGRELMARMRMRVILGEWALSQMGKWGQASILYFRNGQEVVRITKEFTIRDRVYDIPFEIVIDWENPRRNESVVVFDMGELDAETAFKWQSLCN